MKSMVQGESETIAARQEQWQNYVLHGIISEETRQEVLKSWQRCREHCLPADQQKPLRIFDSQTVEELRHKNQLLLSISEPIMRTIDSFISGSGFVIAITDPKGIILRLMGDEKMATAIRGGGFVEGADWSEESAGSNAIGTALVIRKPIQFCGYEHFCTFTQKTACSAAPIFTPEGELAGVIDLTGRLKSINDHIPWVWRWLWPLPLKIAFGFHRRSRPAGCPTPTRTLFLNPFPTALLLWTARA